MQNQMVPTDKKEDLHIESRTTLRDSNASGMFFCLLLLTSFFFLLEISFFIQCNKFYFEDFSFVTDNLKVPTSILPSIFYFIVAQLIVHLIYCLLIYVVTLLVANLFYLSSSKKIRLGIGLWILGLITVLVANQYLFPNSKFAGLTSIIFFNSSVTKISLIILLCSCAVVVFLAGVGLILYALPLSIRKIIYTIIAIVGMSIFLFFLLKPLSITPNIATSKQPNIILVGIDSLRPDFLSYFGYEKSTPFLDSLLKQSTVFSEAVTPLARTFPSWTGILTGKYPRQIGIRSNLAQQQHVDFSQALPMVLKRHGYETMFATDETRFSNIDKNYGFDRIITPPMGLNDFLLGTFNDFPLSNLLMNTSFGKWFFPYSYANRPVYYNYEPDSFINLVRPVLQGQRTKPLFLAIHFCLTHYPYLWASLAGNDFSVLERYEASILRVDEQLRDFFVLLKQNHLLDHALVIVLSDHGEALELPGDRITEKDLFLPAKKNKKIPIPKFYPPSLDKEEINQSAGHGTDVLGLTQYHTLLAFKLYGMGAQQNKIIPGVVSLLDIQPTIFQLMEFNQPPSGGQSLAKVIQGKIKKTPEQRHIFLESDFSPEAIRTVYPETRKVILEGIQIFQINPITMRLTVKDSMNTMIISSKQYADIYGEWMLALYPQSKNDRMPILINLVTGEWTNDLHSNFAKKSPALAMLAALKEFYGNEINKVTYPTQDISV